MDKPVEKLQYSVGTDIIVPSKKLKNSIICVLLTLLAAITSSIALHVFVYPSEFVPLGLEAVVTMLYALFPSINAGWFNIALNVPLVILAWFKLDKKYVVYTLLFTLVSSVVLIVLEAVSFPQYPPTDGKIVAAIFAGVLLGIRTGVMLKIGASTGGIDIIACISQKKVPNVNVERIISVICCVIIGISYFVYKDFNCILLAIVQMFISEKVTTFIMRNNREAFEVKIITKHPEEIKFDIVDVLGHSATLVNSKGMYKNEENTLVFTVINRTQMAKFISTIKKYPDTFVYYSEVQGVLGKFRRHREDPLG